MKLVGDSIRAGGEIENLGTDTREHVGFPRSSGEYAGLGKQEQGGDCHAARDARDPGSIAWREEDESTRSTHHLLARVLRQDRQYEEAEKRYRGLIAMEDKLLGVITPTHSSSATAWPALYGMRETERKGARRELEPAKVRRSSARIITTRRCMSNFGVAEATKQTAK